MTIEWMECRQFAIKINIPHNLMSKCIQCKFLTGPFDQQGYKIGPLCYTSKFGETGDGKIVGKCGYLTTQELLIVNFINIH